MKKLKVFLLFMACIFWISSGLMAQESWSPEHIFYGEGGQLSYSPDEQGNIIPDFSHVGYRMGDMDIPYVEVKVEVSPVEGDDAASIQAAIDQVAALTPDENGFRGAVLLKSGEYQVAGQIVIHTSGIVLRGEGNSAEGTVIIAEGTDRRELIKINNGASRSEDLSQSVNIAESYVPLGRKFVVVENAGDFSEGDDIILYRPGTEKWISDLKMDQITPSEGTVQWDAASYSFKFERKLTRISGDTLFFRNPVVMAMETQYGGGSVYKYSFDRLENTGVEDLCLKSEYASDTDEDHSWKAVSFQSAENSWARNITSWYFAYSCVSLERNAKFITVEDCHCRKPKSIITGGRRYSFNLVGSMNLFRNCSTSEGRHDYVSSSRVCGPNVFTRCTASNANADSGPHHRWAMGTLFDVIETDGAINVQDRDDSGTGHGWAGANQVFWNCKGASSVCQSPWVSAKNYNFGFTGDKNSGSRSGRPDGVWVGQNRPGLFPVSLYEAQCMDRLQDVKVFSAISGLIPLDDSTFIMKFNMPLVNQQIITENFTISGTAGAQDKEFSVEPYDDFSVMIRFANLGILPAFSTIIIKAQNLTSTSGEVLQGLQSGVYTEPDRRPVVTGMTLTVDNVSGFVVASSTKPGNVYLIMGGLYPNTLSAFDSLVSINKGRGAEVVNANVSVPIYTKGLMPGLYNYYATDTDGRISVPDIKWVRIEEGESTYTDYFAPDKHLFTTFKRNNKIVIIPENKERMYSLQVYTIQGVKLHQENHLNGEQIINVNASPGLLVVKVLFDDNLFDSKLIIN